MASADVLLLPLEFLLMLSSAEAEVAVAGDAGDDRFTPAPLPVLVLGVDAVVGEARSLESEVAPRSRTHTFAAAGKQPT